jgi:hypothetical protein
MGLGSRVDKLDGSGVARACGHRQGSTRAQGSGNQTLIDRT